MNIRENVRILASLLVSVVFFSSFTWADIPITVSVTILEPLCSVTAVEGGNKVEVDFGSVGLADVNTTNASKTFNVKITCEGKNPLGKTLKIFLTSGGNGTSFIGGDTVLMTNKKSLGIKLINGKYTIHPGAWNDVKGIDTSVASPSGIITLQAALVSDKTNELSVGFFSASASMVVSYQ